MQNYSKKLMITYGDDKHYVVDETGAASGFYTTSDGKPGI